MDKKLKLSARVFKALCDANRLSILNMLCNGEKCACHLLDALRIGQSTLSHHMKILCDSGIVAGRKDGKWMYYSISKEGVANAKNLLEQFTETFSSVKDKDCC
ncbi:MAG: metalloregulator ArsR/SmtB family transcription factor [Endomicrobia bacterium]|nr:metalloregulator ArsR/SmtB family transcription factor [Endomicrobiia bacterium]